MPSPPTAEIAVVVIDLPEGIPILGRPPRYSPQEG